MKKMILVFLLLLTSRYTVAQVNVPGQFSLLYPPVGWQLPTSYIILSFQDNRGCIYVYTLYVDGRIPDSKQMLLAR